MEIISKNGHPNSAEVFIAKVGFENDDVVEFVDAIDPRYNRNEKWVIVVSTQVGCPVKCLMCDSGTFYKRNLTKEEIFSQIDYVVRRWSPSGKIECPKFKIQFARMGEPSFNPAVIEVIEALPEQYNANGLIPCVATVMPKGSEEWFEKLKRVVHTKYRPGFFQLQISINSTDEDERKKLIPIEKCSFDEINSFGREFVRNGDRKIALNFALPKGTKIDSQILKTHFDPKCFIIKITPVNPTESARENLLDTVLSNSSPEVLNDLECELKKAGFDCIISIGSDEEILIGSNCGQAVRRIIQ